MADNLTTFDHLQQNESDQLKANKSSHIENQFCDGAIVYKKDTGMAFEICKMSRANGIEHFNLLCVETGSSVYLSKFALEKFYSNDESTFAKRRLRAVRRLSELLAK